MIRLSGTARDARRQTTVGLVVEQLRRPVPGGIGSYARGLVRGLAELGEQGAPPLALLASRSPTALDPLASVGPPLEVSRLPGSLLGRAWALGTMGPIGYRLVHSTGLDVPPCDCPLVVTVHDLLWRELPDAYSRHGRAWHEAALRRAVRRAAAFVVPSEAVADALALAVGAGRRVAVIAEGADGLPPPDLGAARSLLGALGVDGRYLLAVGTLEPRKNLARLVAAYSAVRPRLEGLPALVICGPEGWGVDELARPRAGVVATGYVSAATLSALYAGALAFCHVSLGEGFGLPAVEAMAAGLPVLAGRVPAADQAALIVDPTDVAAIGEALVALSGDEQLRARLTARGRARAEVLTWRATAAAHVALWNELAPPR